MKIGELAKRTGLAPSKIRFYEMSGLLKLVDRRPNGYRTYPLEAVTVLNLITISQQVGFSLDEIKALLPANLEQWDHEAVLQTLRRKVTDIEALEQRLTQNKAQLVAVIAEIENTPDETDCTINAKRILSRLFGRGDNA